MAIPSNRVPPRLHRSRPGGEASTQGVSLFVFGIRYIDDIGSVGVPPAFLSPLLHANASGPPVNRAKAGIQTPSCGSACREPGRTAGKGRDAGASALLLTCSPFNSLAASARYYLTDANYNVAMIVTDSGWGVERIFYTAYGEPEVFPFGDADGDCVGSRVIPSECSGRRAWIGEGPVG